MRYRELVAFVLCSLGFCYSSSGGELTSLCDENSVVQPGSKVKFFFPELSAENKEKPFCEVRIPEDFSPSKPVPLIVWLSGGAGSSDTDRALDIVDVNEFLVVAIPYPDGMRPKSAIRKGSIDDLWDFQNQMLACVIKHFPNISKEVRIVAGTSNGAHVIGSGLDRDWPGFADYFTAFVMHEGGASPEMAYLGLECEHRVLVTFGEDTPFIRWQSFFISKIQDTPARVETIVIPNSGHELNSVARTTIKNWITGVKRELSR